MSRPTVPPTVTLALAEAKARGVERLDAQLLLGHVLDRPRSWLLAHDDATLDAAQVVRYRNYLVRRAIGEPVAYLLGFKEFHAMTLQVDSRVLVPRPDTEVVVDWAIEILRSELAAKARPRVVDLGTGSGAIALAVKRAHPAASLVATDASRAALEVAAGNAGRLGLELDFREGSWWQAVADQEFDLAISNPPYIAAGDVHLSALGHEPMEALTPGADATSALRDIVVGAPGRLRRGGWLLLEHGFEQADDVKALFAANGFDRAITRLDLAGRARCTGARLMP